MAIIPKPNKGMRNPHNGTLNQAAYGVIDKLNIDKELREVYFVVAFYDSKAARAAKYPPLDKFGIEVQDPDFSVYFPVSNNAKIWQQAYDYLAAHMPRGFAAEDWKKDPDEEL